MREGWKIKTLEDLFDIGSSKRVYESQWRNSGVPFYRAREIVKLSRDGYVDNELFIDEELYEEYANKYGIPKCGDLMVTGVGTLGVCYIVRDNDKFYFKDGNILWFKSKKGTNPFYVRYAFKSNYLRQQIENCNGATVGTFTIVRAKKTTIPVPPMAEQERIVAELDLLSGIIEKKKEQLKAYDQLAQSIFYTMFGDPIDNPKGWETKKLGDCFIIGSGGTPSKAVPEYWENGEIPWIGSNMCQNCIIEKTDGKFITEEGLNHSSAKVLESGTVLVALVGATIGKVALLKTNTAINQNIAFIQLKKTTSFIPEFVYYHLMGQYDEFMNIGDGKFKMANQAFIKSLSICIPPLSLQQEFAEKVEAIERQKALVQQSIEETQTMFDYTMDKYFG